MPPKKTGRPARPASASRSKRPPPGKAAGNKAAGNKAAGNKAAGNKAAGNKAARTGRRAPGPRPSDGRAGAGARTQVRDSGKRAGGRPSRREPAGDVVLGPVPMASRIVGGLGVLGGLLLAAAVALPHLAVGPERVDGAGSLPAILVSWIWPLVVVAAGVSVLIGAVPRLGLAALGVAGALSVPALLAEAYWVTEAAARGRFEVISGRRLLTSEIEPLSGWYVGVAGLVVLVLGGLAVGWLWSRVVMDDGGGLDPGRPVLGVLAAVTGVTAVLALAVGPIRIPDRVSVSQEIIAGQLRPIETPMPVEGAVGLFDRPGLALAAGLILGLVLVLFSMFATTLRTRLAVVGALAAFTGYVLSRAAGDLVAAGLSEQLAVSVGGWGLLLTVLAFAGLTGVALRWRPPVAPLSRGLPMRPAARRTLKRSAAQ